jgi:hypothetical protein
MVLFCLKLLIFVSLVFSQGCVLVLGKSDPLVLGIGKSRYVTTSVDVPDNAEAKYFGVDSEISTPLIFLGYSNSLSGIVIGPSKVRSTKIFMVKNPQSELPYKSKKYLPFIFHAGGNSPKNSTVLMSRQWVGSIGAKVIQQGQTSTLGIGYQSRVVGSGITESYPWGYILRDSEPRLELLTADTKKIFKSSEGE